MLHAAYIEAALRDYTQVLDAQGDLGLDFLNARVPHRFTGIYQLAHSVMRNVEFFDKLGDTVPQALSAVPLQDSFCQFVVRDGSFITTDSAQDARLNGHTYQGVVGTYYGVPLLDNAGQLFGTLCHFDVMTYSVSDAEFAFLQKAALLLPKYMSRLKQRI
jgi:GAF domain-containing protein